MKLGLFGIVCILGLAASASAAETKTPLAVSDNNAPYVAHCGENSLYQVSFFVQQGRESGFVPAIVSGRPLYCKDNNFTLGDGQSLGDFDVGLAFTETQLRTLDKPDEKPDVSKIKDPELKERILKAYRAQLEKNKINLTEIGRKVREATLAANWGNKQE